MNEYVAKLLNVQTNDVALRATTAKIAAIPIEVGELEAEIARAKKAYADSVAEVAKMEDTRAQMRLRRRAFEDKANKYKSQLETMTKIGNFDAINAEIEKLSAQASEIEDDEILLLCDIDAKRDALPMLESKRDADIVAAQCKIDAFAVMKGDLQIQKSSIETLLSESETEVEKLSGSAPWLDMYRKIRASGKKFPILVKLQNSQCCGCYLKVSGDTADRVSEHLPVVCEHCGRILY